MTDIVAMHLLELWATALSGAGVAVGETVILLHPALPLVGVSMRMKKGVAAE